MLLCLHLSNVFAIYYPLLTRLPEESGMSFSPVSKERGVSIHYRLFPLAD
jgi:hypothetical protein